LLGASGWTRERIAHYHFLHGAEHPPLPAPNVLPDSLEDFLWRRILLIKLD
jgi:hypothetical protein